MIRLGQHGHAAGRDAKLRDGADQRMLVEIHRRSQRSPPPAHCRELAAYLQQQPAIGGIQEFRLRRFGEPGNIQLQIAIGTIARAQRDGACVKGRQPQRQRR
jgi:hypothetical protein